MKTTVCRILLVLLPLAGCASTHEESLETDGIEIYRLGPNPYGLPEDWMSSWIVQEGDNFITPFGFCYVSVGLEGDKGFEEIASELSDFGYIYVPPDFESNEEEFTAADYVNMPCGCGLAADFDYTEKNIYFGGSEYGFNIVVRNPMRIASVFNQLREVGGLLEPYGSTVTTCGDGIASASFDMSFSPTADGTPNFNQLEKETKLHLEQIFSEFKKASSIVAVISEQTERDHYFKFSVSGFTNFIFPGKGYHEKVDIEVSIYPAGFSTTDKLTFVYQLSGWHAPGSAKNPDATDKFRFNDEEIDETFAAILSNKLRRKFGS